MICLQKEELKQRALSIIQLPPHFQPVIEDYFVGEHGEGEAVFSWTNEEQNEGISINLDLLGNLTRFSIDRNLESNKNIPLHIEVRKKHAEAFLISHYPDALKELTFYNVEELSQSVRFYFEQLVMGLPLVRAGCIIDIDSAGNVVNFIYDGVKQIPDIPEQLIPKEKLIEHVENILDFHPKIVNLYSSIHDVSEDGLRLVYEPQPYFMNYKADILQPTLTIEHEEDDEETYISLTPPLNITENKEITIESIIGVSEHMEIIREVDVGKETGIVWRDREWKMDEKDLSVDNFLTRQTKDTVKAFISKETGKVRSFMWFKKRSGDLELEREACYQKAIEFLQLIIPDYYQNLQLIVRAEEEDDTEISEIESFTFHLHNGHGIPVHLEMVIVVVNRATGQINHYSGPSFDIEELSQLATKPAISIKEASAIFMDHLDFELVWNINYDCEIESYLLAYQACDRISGTSIRYIDALTGKVICDKNS